MAGSTSTGTGRSASIDIRRPIGPPQLAPLKKPLTLQQLQSGQEWPDNVGLLSEEALEALQRFLRDAYHMQVKEADNMTIVSQILGGGSGSVIVNNQEEALAFAFLGW